MPPKALARPAAAIGGRAPRAKAKGVAKAKVRVRGILRRPAKAGEAEELGDKDISEAFEGSFRLSRWMESK